MCLSPTEGTGGEAEPAAVRAAAEGEEELQAHEVAPVGAEEHTQPKQR
jgi:hypothetical protein